MFDFLKAIKSKIKVIELAGNPIDIKCKEALDGFVIKSGHIETIDLRDTQILYNDVLKFEAWLATIVEGRIISRSVSPISLITESQSSLSEEVVQILENGFKSGFKGSSLDLTGK